MGFIQRLLQPNKKENRDVGVSQRLMSSLSNSASGAVVTTSTALSVAAVWACVRVLSESVAQLPIILYRRDGNFKERATEHPLYSLLHTAPNPEMTAYHWKQTMMVHLATHGNAYSEIEWGSDGYPVALWPLRPDRTTPVRVEGVLVYDVELPDGKMVRLPAHRVLHIPGLGFDGTVGYSPIKVHRDTIGLTMATQEFGSRFFSNGARPGLILKHPATLSDDGARRLKETIEGAYTGLSNAHRAMILEEGMDIDTVGIPPDAAQFLETRQFQIADIARIYRVPPHMIQDMGRATWANTEEMAEEFVRYTLMPYMKGIEETIGLKLLVRDERDTYFPEFLVDSLLRANTEQRYSAYATGVQSGFLTVNEVRAKENLNPIAGGDKPYMPLNLAPMDGRNVPVATEQRSIETREDAETFADDRVKQADSFVSLFDDTLGRSVRRETKAIRRLVATHLGQRSADEFMAKVAEFYGEFKGLFVRDFTPLLLTQSQQAYLAAMRELGMGKEFNEKEFRQFIDEFLANAAANYIGGSQTEIEKAMESDNPEDAVNEVLDRFENERQTEWSRLLAFEAFNALVIHSYVTVGVREIRWVVNPGACSFCQRLSGRVVGIEQYFVEAGSTIEGEVDGQAVQMKIHGAKRHGPLHSGCSCTIRAA